MRDFLSFMVLGSQFLCAYFKAQHHCGAALCRAWENMQTRLFHFSWCCIDAHILKTSCALDGKGNKMLGAAGPY